MITYDILEPSSDYNASLDGLSKYIGKIYAESWAHDKQETYKKPFDLNIAAFARMWFDHSLKIFLAMEGEEVQGFLVGIVFRPLPYNATVFQVEDWYSESVAVVKGLFEYAQNAIRFIGCDELWVADRADREPLISGGIWKLANTFRLHRYVRE